MPSSLITGDGLELSAPLALTAADLADVGQPTVLVSAENSPDGLRRVNAALATPYRTLACFLYPEVTSSTPQTRGPQLHRRSVYAAAVRTGMLWC